MCELAKHIYKHRDDLIDSSAWNNTIDKWHRISWIDQLMSYHYHECAECKAVMDERRERKHAMAESGDN